MLSLCELKLQRNKLESDILFQTIILKSALERVLIKELKQLGFIGTNLIVRFYDDNYRTYSLFFELNNRDPDPDLYNSKNQVINKSNKFEFELTEDIYYCFIYHHVNGQKIKIAKLGYMFCKTYQTMFYSNPKHKLAKTHKKEIETYFDIYNDQFKILNDELLHINFKVAIKKREYETTTILTDKRNVLLLLYNHRRSLFWNFDKNVLKIICRMVLNINA